MTARDCAVTRPATGSRPRLRGVSASRGTILVIDDEDAVQRLVRFPLEREGYRVLGAMSGEDGLRLVEAERPDLVLLDLMLPGMDGIEVCRRLRVLSATLPIIMLTARDDEVDKVLGLEIGADDYVTKPFSLAELRSRVRAVLRRAQRPPGAPGVEDVPRGRGRAPGRRAPHRRARRRARAADVRGVRDPAQPDALARAACSRGARCSRACGTRPTTASSARSTCTSGTCARSSSAIPPRPT